MVYSNPSHRSPDPESVRLWLLIGLLILFLAVSGAALFGPQPEAAFRLLAIINSLLMLAFGYYFGQNKGE